MNEKIKKITTICVICVVFCVFATIAVLSLIGTRKDIQNHGNGTNAVRDEFKTIRDAQQEETRVIVETARAIDRSQKAVTNSEQTNREIASVERADAEIIAECEQIFARVRKRTATEN